MAEGAHVGGGGSGRSGAARLLGTVELEGPDGRTVTVNRPQVQLALAHLLLERRPVERGELAEVLWGDAPLSPHWQGAVRGVLSKVRDAFDEAGVDADVVAGADGTVRLVLPEGFACDVDEAEAEVREAEAALDAARPVVAARVAEPWVERLQRPFLVAGDGDWVRAAQQRVAELARRALLVQVRSLLADGRAGAAATAATAWAHHHPLDEQAHHLRIRALVADGRRAEAVAAYDQLADLLARELGVGPAAATAALVDAPGDVASLPAPAGRARSARSAPTDAFLGRVAELAALRRTWSSVVEHGTVAVGLVSGASGIGKTRLAEELAAVAVADGATVCWGRCQPGSGVPFEPIASAVLAVLDADRLVAVGEDPGLVDDLAGIVAGRELLDDPGLARAHRFRTIVRAVRAVSASPTLLVVDDLQWASLDVLALLEQVAEEVDGSLLLLATGRNLPAAVHEHLARLQRLVGVELIRLEGLEVDDLVPLVDGAVPDGSEVRSVAIALHRRTAGHPYLVREVVGAGSGAGRGIDLGGVPDAVREWIGHRVDALPTRLRARLDLAAVLGAELRLGDLARAAGAGEDEVLDDVEALVRHGFLVEREVVDAFGFVHALTQEAVYERIGPSRRARLHVAAAEALRRGPEVPGRHAAIAGHLAQAGDAHRVDASRAGSAAGREALEQGAWELAEALFTAAIERAGGDGAARADGLTGLGAALHHQRRGAEAEALLLEAVALARAHRLPDALADAALVLVGRAGRGAARSLTDAEQAALLREALAGVEGRLEDAELERSDRVRWETRACRLEGELALALLLTAPLAERAELTSRAVDRARRIDPPDTRLTARALLSGRISKLGPEQLGERLADLDQVLALDPDGVSVETSLAAHTYRHEDLLRLGRRAEAQASLHAAAELAHRHPHPYWRWAIAAWQALDALIDGNLDEAEARAGAALGLQGEDVDGALACYGVHLVDLRLYQGRAGEVLDLLTVAADANPQIPCYRAVLALCAAEAGELDRAAAAYGAFAADGFASIPDDTNRLLALVVLADVAAQFDDRSAAAHLLPQLEPYRGQQALLNCYGGGGSYWGPVAHQLARLAALEGRDDEAAASFAEAEAEASAMAAPLALTRIVADPLRAVVA